MTTVDEKLVDAEKAAKQMTISTSAEVDAFKALKAAKASLKTAKNAMEVKKKELDLRKAVVKVSKKDLALRVLLLNLHERIGLKTAEMINQLSAVFKAGGDVKLEYFNEGNDEQTKIAIARGARELGIVLEQQ